MPKITADVPENLFRFLRGHIVDQRIAGVHITVSTIVTNLLSRWERERLNLHDAENNKTEEVKDQTNAKTPSSMDYAEEAFSFEITGEEIKHLILSARLTTEEAKQVAASLIRITQELLELTATIRKK
jgi:hypothetical protein